MANLGFGERWIRWIKTCVTTTRVSVLVNGSPTNEFCPQKGLRQGDPLSPFLFNVAAEGLNLLLERAKRLGVIKGATVGSTGLKLSHLQFANDTLLFCAAELEEIVNVKRILRCFEVMSGLTINFHKSVVCGVGINDDQVQVLASSMHCVTQKLPIKYLGLPLGANPRRTKTWQNVVDKVKSRLALWKRKLLSFASRLTLVKSVMDSLPGYYISIFKLPKGIAKEIDKLKAAFLWGSSEFRRKIHMVKWTDVTLSKDKGGLGIRKAKESNDCLLLKWWWRYGVEDESLWKRVIVSKYGADGGRWLPIQNGEGKESVVWSDILSVAALNPELFQFFASKLQIVVGNGSRILFWHDRWCMNLKLKEEFPRLFRLSMEKEEKLSYFMQRRDRDGHWSLQFRRPLFSWEEEEVGKLQELTKDVPRLNENLCDGVKWTASASGVFTVASVRSWLQKNSGTSLQVPKMLWNNLAPPKAQFLCWLAWRGRVKAAVVLQRLGVLGGNANVACPFCLAAEESVDHLFVQCPQIWKVWGKLMQWWNLCWVSPATVDGVLSWWLGTKHRKLVKKIWMLVPVAMLWSTWRLRNEIVFKGHLPDMLELGEVVKVRVEYWVRASLPSVHYSVHHIVENLSQIRRHNAWMPPFCKERVICLAIKTIGLLAIIIVLGDNAHELLEELFSMYFEILNFEAMIIGRGDNAHELFEKSLSTYFETLNCEDESAKDLKCLAIVTFVDAKDSWEIENLMIIIWEFIVANSVSDLSDHNDGA
ncbi:uncharacterized protein LOC114289749 [Camellia sinensis]|uniref:uncharacterized protein LOC114289749 n=1 Tax=Camellia sinensis TaxID=4442 RepID=UPI001035ED7A|nr:uncharacterized protein LOC114289749 [Camellia sinensis]